MFLSVFFFKQKTAYEMRISDWSSDVCSSDLAVGVFSAALRVAEVWYFIPMAITGAAFPRMLEKRTADPTTYQRYTQGLYDGMAWLGLAVAVLVSLSAQKIGRAHV